ncbi:DnaJ domain-containing protein [Natronoarchaeum philippinense]|uniref:DnaJ domain-containing protein n=1 Tax=Natronoarchaeum philippinense TaxID=558529 RepID=A0A285N6Q5_NATPI|nr:J domain-containing protein [Natronoarchaeum philippinense]SNZ04613.1 DnaJ domain-containing protein [Natronoarchaeum philippinense]
MWEAIAALPEWLIVGLGIAAAASLLIAAAFAAGEWLFPPLDDRQHAPEREGAERRVSEIRSYLDGIGERYVEDATVDGQRVRFYLPERDVAITFDARTFYRLDGSETEPVLVEHELPGASLGSRLPFETPTVDADPDIDHSVASAFAALGVPASADAEEVRRAYRRRIKDAHPDQGGDEAEFRRIRDAYDTAREHAD